MYRDVQDQRETRALVAGSERSDPRDSRDHVERGEGRENRVDKDPPEPLDLKERWAPQAGKENLVLLVFKDPQEETASPDGLANLVRAEWPANPESQERGEIEDTPERAARAEVAAHQEKGAHRDLTANLDRPDQKDQWESVVNPEQVDLWVCQESREKREGQALRDPGDHPEKAEETVSPERSVPPANRACPEVSALFHS